MTYALCPCGEELDWIDERYHEVTLHHVHLMRCPKCQRYFVIFSNWLDAIVEPCDPSEFEKLAQDYLSHV